MSVPCSGADGFPESGDVIVEAEASTTFDPGDGTGAIGSPFGPLLYLITSVDQSNNLVNGFALDPTSLPDADLTVAHAYSEAGVYRAFVDGLPRMGTVEGNVNNGDQAFRLETLVNVGTAELASPLAGSAPVVLCGIDEVCSFPIDAFDRTDEAPRPRRPPRRTNSSSSRTGSRNCGGWCRRRFLMISTLPPATDWSRARKPR